METTMNMSIVRAKILANLYYGLSPLAGCPLYPGHHAARWVAALRTLTAMGALTPQGQVTPYGLRRLAAYMAPKAPATAKRYTRRPKRL